MHKVLVIGGYGFFGARIAAELSRNEAIRVFIAGRDRAQAGQAASRLGLAADRAVRIDAASSDFPGALRSLGADTVVHTAGPFQGQDYRVASAAIEAGCNYIDLADGRAFVAGIAALDAEARGHGVAVVSGASSVPALSAAVVDHYRPAFDAIDSINLGISSGARAPGLATVRGIFGYCGKPIRRLEDGAWVESAGWLDLRRHRFPDPVGERLLGSCDVPDLELFPARYAGVRTVTFHAGFASAAGHLAVWTLAQFVRSGLLKSAAPFAGALNRLSRWLEPVISDKGGMFVRLQGRDRAGRPMTRLWHLVASQNHGPYIPCGAAIALVNKLAAGVGPAPGARPCMGLLTIDEYLAPLARLDIKMHAEPV